MSPKMARSRHRLASLTSAFWARPDMANVDCHSPVFPLPVQGARFAVATHATEARTWTCEKSHEAPRLHIAIRWCCGRASCSAYTERSERTRPGCTHSIRPAAILCRTRLNWYLKAICELRGSPCVLV